MQKVNVATLDKGTRVRLIPGKRHGYPRFEGHAARIMDRAALYGGPGYILHFEGAGWIYALAKHVEPIDA